MRRAAVQAFRTARRLPVRNIPERPPASLFTSNHAIALRSASFASSPALRPAVLQSSLLFRNFSLAFISTLVASGAWFAYTENKPEGAGVALNNTGVPIAFNNQGLALQASALSPTQALVVQPEQLYASAAVENQPLSKTPDDSASKKVGMLTPEEATRKLRKSEESYLVGRGRGVVRYDLVQLASNDPIEDDHAEKIVEIPSTIAPTEDGSQTSDWMFWGVFDGHS